MLSFTLARGPEPAGQVKVKTSILFTELPNVCKPVLVAIAEDAVQRPAIMVTVTATVFC